MAHADPKAKTFGGRFRVELCVHETENSSFFRVFDASRGETLGLRALTLNDPASIMQFKSEFRILSELRHPNCLRVRDLWCHNDEWFYTTEWIDGQDVRSWVHGHPDVFVATRIVLMGVASALSALHWVGVTHAKLVPSSVVVTADSRVVLWGASLYFEHSRTFTPTRLFADSEIPYTAPERLTGEPATPASDYFSLGAILCELLTGQPPLADRTPDAPLESLPDVTLWPEAMEGEVPYDLNSIADKLLRLDPAERLQSTELLEAMVGRTQISDVPLDSPSSPRIFVGRDREKQSLRDCLEQAIHGRPHVAILEGSLGIGCSALVASFVREVLETKHAVVLTSTCFERECVPYKGFDQIVDNVHKILSKLPFATRDYLLPADDALQLAKVFPTLLALKDSSTLPVVTNVTDRRRVHAAMAGLLSRMCELRPLVVVIEDIHRAEPETFDLLRYLLSPSVVSPILWIVTKAREIAMPQLPIDAPHLSVTNLKLSELTDQSSIEVARQMLPEHIELATSIALESAGNPGLIADWCSFVRVVPKSDAPMTAQSLTAARLAALSQNKRKILEFLAVAGRPLSLRRLFRLTGGPAEPDVIASLADERLIRRVHDDSEERIAIAHDRLANAILGSLRPQELALANLKIGQDLEVDSPDEHEEIAQAFMRAGSKWRAGLHCAKAAENAVNALAYEKAVSLYQLALELAPEGALDSQSIRARLADTLVTSGRLLEAASHYMWVGEQVADANRELSLELHRKSAICFFFSGHTDEAESAIGSLLKSLDCHVSLANSPTFSRTTWVRAGLRLRGLSFRPKPVQSVFEDDILRLKALSTAISIFTHENPARAHDVQARHLALALRTGHRDHAAEAFAFEAFFASFDGHRNRRHVDKTLEKAAEIQPVSNPAAATVALYRGLAHFHMGDFFEAESELSNVDATTHDDCHALPHRSTAQSYYYLSLTMRGAVSRIVSTLDPSKLEAQHAGDLRLLWLLRAVPAPLVWMAHDRAEEGLKDISQLEDVLKKERTRPAIIALGAASARAELLLYLGKIDEAFEALTAAEEVLQSSSMHRMAVVTNLAHWTRARVGLALAARTNQQAVAGAAMVDRAAANLAKDGAPAWKAVADWLLAMRQVQQGNRREALERLEKAGTDARRLHLENIAGLSRFWLAELHHGEVSVAMKKSVAIWFASQRITNARQWVKAFCGA